MSAQSVLFDAPGPKAKARHRIYSGVGLLLLAGLMFLVLSKLGEKGQLDPAKWTPFFNPKAWSNYILPGLWNMLRAAVLAVLLALVFGVIFGIGRLSEIAPIRWVSTVVVEFFRSVPVLLMMIFLFYFFAFNGLFPRDSRAFVAVVLALMLYNGAVVAELVRSGVYALPKGQSEAGLSIGLTRAKTLRLIQLPQALTAMLPALISQLVVVVKDTALGYQITYPELLKSMRNMGTNYANILPAYIVAGLLFILINYALTRVAVLVEKRLRSRGGGVVTGVTAEPEAPLTPAAAQPVGPTATGRAFGGPGR